MPKARKVFNELLGVWEDEYGGDQNTIYQAFHGTGSFDPRLNDQDFLDGKQRYKPRRAVITLSVAGETIDRLEKMAAETGASRGRLVDALVRRGWDFLEKKKKGNGDGETEG